MQNKTKVKTKICGLSRIVDIEAVNKILPDYIGFVFAKSKRQVSPEQADKLRKILSPSIIPVGVFVNEPIDNILSILDLGIIEIVQLHGGESEDYIRDLKEKTTAPIIKAIGVETASDILAWENSSADFLLLDNKVGGSGKTFDWNLIPDMSKPFFLAGGLNPQNVEDAIKKTHPYAVDVSGGVESDGLKDADKIKHFVELAEKI